MSLTLPKNYQPDEYARTVLDALEHSTENILLLGRAGTGKSTLIEYFKRNTRKNFIVVASTGVAAMNVGGQTIHSFFRLPIGYIEPDDVNIKKWEKYWPCTDVLARLDMVILDEVSMVNADLLDGLDQTMRLQLGSREPFGGVQMVLVGDCYQLAPVENEADAEKYYERYKSPYFFSATAFATSFKAGAFRFFELEQVHRQKNGPFLDILNQVRLNQVEPGSLELLNTRVVPTPPQYAPDEEQPILLCTTNRTANEENARKLASLAAAKNTYKGEVSGDFRINAIRAEEELELCVGARIMMLTNDQQQRWVNGSLGSVVKLFKNDEGQEIVRVKLDSGPEYDIGRHTWENAEYRASKEGVIKHIKGTFKQFGLRLAWAITIHKSQGLTFDQVRIDLGRGTFAKGQLYVALSRCRSLEGIQLLRPVTIHDVSSNDMVDHFTKWMRDQMLKQADRPLFNEMRRPDKPMVNASGKVIRPKATAEQKAEEERKRQQAREANLAKLQAKNAAEGKATNHGARYVAEELDEIKAAFIQGNSVADIAKMLGRAPNSVGDKMSKMGLFYWYYHPKQVVVHCDVPEDELPKLPPKSEPEGETGKKPRENNMEAYDKWTPEQEDLLKGLFHDQADLEAIITATQRSPKANLAKLLNLGLIGPDNATWGPFRLKWFLAEKSPVVNSLANAEPIIDDVPY